MNPIQKPLPFFDERKTSIDMLVFHCNIFAPNDFIKTLEQTTSQLSLHYRHRRFSLPMRSGR